jgi:hypothetical protein
MIILDEITMGVQPLDQDILSQILTVTFFPCSTTILQSMPRAARRI